jgi:peptidoglycan/xylan/chitin deacetylase (PgdA/CDA1 family)
MLGILAGAAAAAGLGTAGWASMAPRSQLFGKTFTGIGQGSRQIALTYDDGPNDPHTLRLLEVLEKYGVKATFFMIGRYVRQKPEIARAVAQAGHVVGNHTFTHPNLIFAGGSETGRQLDECEQALSEVVGEHSRLFRPPFGGRTPRVLQVARVRGLEPIMWSVTGYDWSAKSAEEVEGKVTRHVRGGDVILLHDGGHLKMGADRSFTVTATERLITRYKGEGYEFVTIEEMMQGS